MKSKDIIGIIKSGNFDSTIKNELCSDRVEYEKERIINAINTFEKLYGNDRDLYVISVGGRSEISGNHTDHNNGKVIAASINLSVIAIASKRNDGEVHIKSEGFDEDVVLPSEVDAPSDKNRYKSSAIIAGMENAFLKKGLAIGGFDAYTVSDVLKGSGLSSSAAFEVTVGKIISCLYNDNKVENLEIAKMSQYAENVFFGKPCGLMDQAACAIGGFITIDFRDNANPLSRPLDFNIGEKGYALCITNVGANHSDLNEEYAAVPSEMKSVAKFFGKNVLRELDRETVLDSLAELRKECSDRAVLRALHFFDENERVENQVAAIEKDDVDGFFKLVCESGNSSYRYLQNVYPSSAPHEQSMSLALYLTEAFMKGKKGGYRVHGGGFAGTIQAFVPLADADDYKTYMEKYFGCDSCYILNVRKVGAVRLF